VATYRHATVDVVAGRVREYLDALGEVYAPIASERRTALVGAFQVAATSGRWPQVIVITQFDEASRSALQPASVSGDSPMDRWNALALQYRAGGFDRLLTLLPFSPQPPVAPQFASSGRVFFQQTYVVKPGAGRAFVERTAGALAAHASGEGVKLEAFWRSAHQPLEHVALCSMASWEAFAAMQAERESRAAIGEEAIPGLDDAWDTVDDVQERLLMPAAYSPLGGGQGSLVVTI
jgi:hypothetical protein